MNYLSFARRVLSSACVLFTCILLLFYLIAASVLDEPALSASNALLCLLFSFLFAAANQLFTIPRFSMVWKIALHLTATLTAFILVLFVCTGYYQEHGTFAVGASVVYVIAYAAAALSYFFVRRALVRKEQAQTPYKPQY